MTEAALIETRVLTVGTRGSALARWQSEWVARGLEAEWPGLRCRFELFTTAGDKLLDRPLPEIGGKGLFTEELEQVLRAGSIDLAVHSLKDLPVAPSEGLALGAIAAREDARDVLVCPVGHSLAGLPAGSRLGTSSLRRAAQLRLARPDLVLVPARGNVDTRLRKARAGEYDAVVLAAAGLLRLGLEAAITEYLPFDVMLPAPGQGALAVQCRADDAATLARLAALDDARTRSAVIAERAFLAGLGGGCSAPIAALAQVLPGGRLSLRGLVAASDGSGAVRVIGEGDDPESLGATLAADALARGAGAWLS